jgi:hypothetical protein
MMEVLFSSWRILAMLFLKLCFVSSLSIASEFGLLVAAGELVLVFVSRVRSALQGRLKRSSAMSAESAVCSEDVEGRVCRSLRLRPFMPVVKMQVPFQGEVKLRCGLWEG